MARRSLRERFAWHSIQRYARQHARTYTLEEKYAALHWLLIEEMGATICRCGRYWKESTLDAEAQQLGVTIIRNGEATLEICPRCALNAQLLGVLESRTQGVQLSLF